jgi:hypothetical protein
VISLYWGPAALKLSNVAVHWLEVLWLVKTKPTQTLPPMLIVSEPTDCQLTPSLDLYAVKVFPLRTSFTQ